MMSSSNSFLVQVAIVISVISFLYAEPHSDAVRPELSRNRRFFWKPDVGNFKCPAIYGRYPHPASCEFFYECRFGWPTLMHCNHGFLYDEEREQCRDRRKVHCHRGGHKKDEDKVVEKEKEVPTEFKCPYTWGTFAHPVDCSKYYVCLYNMPSLHECYGTDLYHDKARRCLPKKRVQCGKRLNRDEMRTSRKPESRTTVVPEATTRHEEITTGISTTTEGHESFNCPFPWGRYADPKDCSRYYECRFAKSSIRQCPQSTLYDERKEECLKQEQVKCGNRPGGVGGKPEEGKKENFHCPYIWGTFAQPDDCSKYIVCVYNVPTIFACRKDQLFHARYRRCLPKDKVSCDDRINPDGKDVFPDETVEPTRETTPELTTETTPEPTTEATPEPTTEATPEPTTEATPEPTTDTTRKPTTDTTRKPTTDTTHKSTTGNTRKPTTDTTHKPTTGTTHKPTTGNTRKPTTDTSPKPITPPITTERQTTTGTTIALCSTQPVKVTTGKPTAVTTTEPTRDTATETRTVVIQVSTETVTKPNTPPPIDCDEEDLDCIIDGTGDVNGWFDCPQRFGHYPHGSSKQLFIHCDNWRPFVKKCADETFFSPEYLVCMWVDKKKGI